MDKHYYAATDGVVKAHWFAHTNMACVYPVDAEHPANCVAVESDDRATKYAIFGLVKLQIGKPIESGEYIVSGDDGKPLPLRVYPDRIVLAQALESSLVASNVIYARMI